MHLPDGTIIDTPASHSIVVVGANGAGKTRFTTAILAGEQNAFAISAVDALYSSRPLPGPAQSVDSLFAGAAIHVAPDATGFDRLLALLLHDEMLNLLSFKFARAGAPDEAVMQPTPLDRIIEQWQGVFPDNRMLVEGGRLLFTRGDDTRGYDALRLSAGERAVIYYIGAALYAPQGAVVAVNAPEMFLHPTLMVSLWNRIELLRPDCTWIYTTHDLEFATSRRNAATVWVRDYDPAAATWSYSILPHGEAIPDKLLMAVTGSRKPIMFIEGDDTHSIDVRLYPLIFPDYSVKPLGSCTRVIEATRTFNDLRDFHKLDSVGIVDRDRRDDKEVAYLRRKRVMVPEVAEIENLFMLPEVITAVARASGHDPDRTLRRVRRNVVGAFAREHRDQALQHTRHRIKQLIAYNIDARFSGITALERHLNELPALIDARGIYNGFCAAFRRYADTADYPSVLKVYNRKSMLSSSGVAKMCGLPSREAYIDRVIAMLHCGGRDADTVRDAMRRCLGIRRAPR